MEHIKELSNKMTTMLNNYMNNLKNLMLLSILPLNFLLKIIYPLFLDKDQ